MAKYTTIEQLVDFDYMTNLKVYICEKYLLNQNKTDR